MAIPPSNIAPPTPPTTPPIVFLDELLKPELPELLLLPFKVALVEAAKTVLLVRVAVTRTPLLVVTSVVVKADVLLDVERETVSVATALVSRETVVDPAEFVVLAVEVVKTTDVLEGDEGAASVMVEDVSCWVVLGVVEKVVVVVGGIVVVVGVVVVVTPVDSSTCRLWLAMAMSRLSAQPRETSDRRKRDTVAN